MASFAARAKSSAEDFTPLINSSDKEEDCLFRRPPERSFAGQAKTIEIDDINAVREIRLGIVIDDGFRLSCPMGIKLAGNRVTVLADRQRVLRCWVP